MSARAGWVFIPAVAAVALACGRGDRTSSAELRAQIDVLEKERDALDAKLHTLMLGDPLLEGLPTQPVLVGVPTALASELITKVMTGFVDQVTLDLKNLSVKRSGTVRRIVDIGDYEVQVRIHRVTGKLKTGTPALRFGGNQVRLAMPVRVASGSGRATIAFKWNGKGVSGALCGDMDITRDVTGGVKPASYSVAGGIVFTPTPRAILASPRFPLIKVNLKVEPSEESWAAVEKILEEKQGLCGYVLEKVNLIRMVQGLIERGFNVRLPTEKIKPMAVPVGIEPTIEVRGQPVALAIKLGQLAITEQMIWLGADVHVDMKDLQLKSLP